MTMEAEGQASKEDNTNILPTYRREGPAKTEEVVRTGGKIKPPQIKFLKIGGANSRPW